MSSLSGILIEKNKWCHQSSYNCHDQQKAMYFCESAECEWIQQGWYIFHLVQYLRLLRLQNDVRVESTLLSILPHFHSGSGKMSVSRGRSPITLSLLTIWEANPSYIMIFGRYFRCSSFLQAVTIIRSPWLGVEKRLKISPSLTLGRSTHPIVHLNVSKWDGRLLFFIAIIEDWGNI